MSTTDKKTPAWLLERLAQGELDRETAAEVRARLAAEGRSPDDELAALAHADREMLAAHPPAAAAAEIARRAAARPPVSRRPFVFGVAFATAGALAIVLAGRHAPLPAPGSPPEPTSETIGIKGTAGPRLYVYRHGADRDRRLADGARATAGDLLQLTYATPAPAFGVLVSIDGAGAVTQHWPAPGAARALPLRVGAEVRLPSAYELDDAPAFERFFLVHAEQPFDVAPVVDAARTLAARTAEARRAPLALPAALGQISLTLEKTR